MCGNSLKNIHTSCTVSLFNLTGIQNWLKFQFVVLCYTKLKVDCNKTMLMKMLNIHCALTCVCFLLL